MHQIVIDVAAEVGMKVSFAEVLEHADGVDARLRAGDWDVAVAAVGRLHRTRVGDAVVNAHFRLLFLSLVQQALARSTASLTVGVRLVAGRIADEVRTGFRVQRVAELACQTVTIFDVVDAL